MSASTWDVNEIIHMENGEGRCVFNGAVMNVWMYRKIIGNNRY